VFDCPVCHENDWERGQTYRYTKDEDSAEKPFRSTEYVQLRRQVLFEVWFPDVDEVTLDSVMCRSCGFMTYSPRPTELEIDAKYRFLQGTEGNIGGQKSDPKLRALDQQRALRVFRTVCRHTQKEALDVLDFGGGDGKLLRPFFEQGHTCALIDYNVQPLEGVRKIGNSLDDVCGGETFDVIICSHVIEHLAEPGQTIGRLVERLRDGGVLYGEVPLGVWGGIGIKKDPVTHINFFTEHSFCALFENLRLKAIEHRQMVGVYNRRMDVVMLVARKGGEAEIVSGIKGVAETRRLLHPSVVMRVRRRWRLREFPTMGGVARRLHLSGTRVFAA